METIMTQSKSVISREFDKARAADLAGSMNDVMANYHVFYQKLRNFHWNVTGGDFFDLHEKFEEIYTEAIENIDEIAERIRVFDMTPLSRLQDYLEKSEIREAGTDLSGDQMVAEILNDMETLHTYFLAVLENATEIQDMASINMMNRMIQSLEKQHWMLKAFAG